MTAAEKLVTVIGLGMIGAPIAGAFQAAGHRLTVWNRSADRADAVVAEGAVRADTVVEAVSVSPLVVVCVSNYDAVRDILGLVGGPVGQALSGRVLVNLTTGTPQDAREMATWAASTGTDYLDGAIMAVPETIGQPEALLLYSGSPDAFDAHEEVLDRLGTSRFLGDDAARASLYDAGLLAAMYGMYAGFFHAAALVGAENIAVTEFTSLLVPWLNATSALLPGFARQIDEAKYPNDVSSVVVNRDAMANILRVSRAQGIGIELLGPLHALAERRADDGHGDDGFASLIEVYRQR